MTGGKLDGLRQFTALTKYRGRQYKFIIHVVKTNSCSNLLGRAAAVAMGLVKRMDEVQSMFDAEVGLLKLKPDKIYLRDDAVSYSVNNARTVSAPMLPKVKAELEKMVKCGVIEGVTDRLKLYISVLFFKVCPLKNQWTWG